MPLGLGLASSHAPSMFAKPEDWPRLHETLTGSVPQPPQIREETPEVIDQYVKRIQKNFRTLREQLEAYQPDALIVVGDDQNEVFSRACIPALAIYLGAQAQGLLERRSAVQTTTVTPQPAPRTAPEDVPERRTDEETMVSSGRNAER